jgi:hypothetical protein
LSALIEVIGIIDARGGENAATLVEIANRVGKLNAPEQHVQSMAAFVESNCRWRCTNRPS